MPSNSNVLKPLWSNFVIKEVKFSLNTIILIDRGRLEIPWKGTIGSDTYYRDRQVRNLLKFGSGMYLLDRDGQLASIFVSCVSSSSDLETIRPGVHF